MKKIDRLNRPAIKLYILLLLGFGCLVGGCYVYTLNTSDFREWEYRKDDLLVLSKKGDEIVKAISRYRAKNGKYPESLSELVPGYITKLPSNKNSSIRHHDFRLTFPSDDSDFSGYKLSVFTPRFFMNFDELFYYPNHCYPDEIHNQRVEKLEDWAYLHE